MHPRTPARQDCSGGTCPAVYGDDPDLAPGELAIVGSTAAASLRAKLADRIAPHEELVVIKREIVAEALRPAPEPVGLAELQAQFETFSFTAWRLETLQSYASTGPDGEWIALLKASRHWRKTHQRVHVVIEPLSYSMRHELTAGYEGNVRAGEYIGILPVGSEDEWPPDVPQFDFWLFDSASLYVMHYKPDGTWAGADRITDPERIAAACRVRDAAMFRSMPWHSYMQQRFAAQ